ncbi:c-type cytochrome [Bordetella bronchiseptica]|uniref:c-type cytochrome n=1 Tax=Bordetella bronchiseptica TaxID=518 RepID=UPI00028FE5B3|nr:c-type cytochrome [Bordetella bronchiseptica]QET71979.1 cytochrome c [Bordetella bronchiseptica]CCN02587.1 putative cytochrome [Bordetella bronchiseptica Bbr77]
MRRFPGRMLKWLVLACGLATAAGLLAWRLASSSDYIAPAAGQDRLRGQAIYQANCAACHGAQLEGQPDWRQRLASGRLPAPPHDASGHTWHHPDAVLLDIIRHGMVPGRHAPDGYQSDMPAYAGVLSDAEIALVLAYIKSTWPGQVQQDQRAATQQMTPR